MGGGTTIIEGLRLGMNCIGVDINPVAWFITKTESVMVDLEELRGIIKECEKTLEHQVKKWYRTSCPECNNSADIIYTHWVKCLPCPTCSFIIPIFRNFLVGYLGNERILLCPSCNAVFPSDKPLSSEINCPECTHNFNPSVGYRKGRKVLQCPDCGDSIQILDEIKLRESPLSCKPFAIEGYCPFCAEEKGRDPKLAKYKFKFINKISQDDNDLYT